MMAGNMQRALPVAALLLALLAAACGGDADGTDVGAQSVTPTAAEQPTQEPTPTAEPTAAPTPTPEPSPTPEPEGLEELATVMSFYQAWIDGDIQAMHDQVDPAAWATPNAVGVKWGVFFSQWGEYDNWEFEPPVCEFKPPSRVLCLIETQNSFVRTLGVQAPADWDMTVENGLITDISFVNASGPIYQGWFFWVSLNKPDAVECTSRSELAWDDDVPKPGEATAWANECEAFMLEHALEYAASDNYPGDLFPRNEAAGE